VNGCQKDINLKNIKNPIVLQNQIPKLIWSEEFNEYIRPLGEIK